MDSERVKIAIVGSGPAGLSAAARAAELKIPHLLLEAEPHLSHTIHRYQKGKHVMAEPEALPLRASTPFAAGKREDILGAWSLSATQRNVQVRHRYKVESISGKQGQFVLRSTSGETIEAQHVVLAIGLQGNIRKLGCAGEDLAAVQYQLNDPDEYRGETIAVVGAGDAAIENALALALRNKVSIVNRREEFDRAKRGNILNIQKAIEEGRVTLINNATPGEVRQVDAKLATLVLNTAQGVVNLPCNRVIARLGATPPRQFVESCGVVFPSTDPNAVPVVSPQYESNVPGLYIIGALAGFPLIKQAMNQGYEVIEFIEGRRPAPADTPLLEAKFKTMPGYTTVDAAIALIRAKVPVLSPLTPLQLREFLLDSDIRVPKTGALIFSRNDYSDSFYSVLAGSVKIALDEKDDSKSITLVPGQFFGEMSLISGRRRSATVYAGSGAVLIETPRSSMNKLIASVAAVKRLLDETFLLRSIQARIAPGLTAADLKDVVATAVIGQYKAGDALFVEGQEGDCLHLIRKGSVTIARDLGGRETVLAYVPAGQYVGEMALLTELPRSATARAAIATETIMLQGAEFKALMAAHPALRAKVGETFKQRVVANTRARSEQGSDGVVQFLIQQGVGEATDVLLIDESLCTRCDNCEKACADTHGGVSRLDREAGPTYENLHIPTSCRHCEHPHCMKDCPPDAIRRSPGGEVFITDACIGCGNCEKNCPYGVIQMGVTSTQQPSLLRWLMFGGAEPGEAKSEHAVAKIKGQQTAKKAVKCDMCKALSGGPACVRACPTGAAIRVSPEQFLQVTQRGG